MTLPVDEMVSYLQCLDGCQEEMVNLVQRLCNQNSGTYNLDGLQAVREMLADEYARLAANIHVREIEPQTCVDDAGQRVTRPLGSLLHLVKRPEVRPRVLLCIHMDTVYAVQDDFQACVWEKPDRLNGPGVADAKGGLVVMLYALQAFESSPWAEQIGWEVIINPDEEIGSVGSA